MFIISGWIVRLEVISEDGLDRKSDDFSTFSIRDASVFTGEFSGRRVFVSQIQKCHKDLVLCESEVVSCLGDLGILPEREFFIIVMHITKIKFRQI